MADSVLFRGRAKCLHHVTDPVFYNFPPCCHVIATIKVFGRNDRVFELATLKNKKITGLLLGIWQGPTVFLTIFQLLCCLSFRAESDGC